MRRFSEPVHVRWEGGDRGGPAPVQFIWRRRLYVVQAVLEHWRERSAWWEHAAVAAVHGDGPSRGGSRGGPRRDGPRDIATLAPPAPRSVLEIGDLEREVWRVEARAGRHADVGVYDLARPVPAPRPVLARTGPAGAAAGAPADAPAGAGFVSEATGTSTENAWQLLRVSD
ncbi:DUF6504 family protein [Kineococcus gynurae]|uniref:DUF6504 family protein n=1 Tax=Kineococcus gynurae TaxID=452979 RepID=A0ABV5LUF0_9ACTN